MEREREKNERKDEEKLSGRLCKGFTRGDQVGMQAAKQPTAGSMIVQEILAVVPDSSVS